MTAKQATQRRPSRIIDNPRRDYETESKSALLRPDSQGRQQERRDDAGERRCRAASVGGGQGAADALQRLALGGNGEQRPDQRRREHQDRAEQVAAENAPARASVDQGAEYPGSCHAAYAGPHGIEEGDSK